MKKLAVGILMGAGALLIAAPVFAQEQGQGRAVVTILAKHSEVAPQISQQDLAAKVNGKDAAIAQWVPLKGANDGLEIVVLIDSGARNLGRQFEEIKQFILGQNPHTKVVVGYMENGRAALVGSLSFDHAQAVHALHLPAGPYGNPYFSLSDLAQNWPSRQPGVRRAAVLISDGIDPDNRRFDPEDPYVQTAIKDTVRAGIQVYSVYWQSRADGGDNSMVSTGGQSLMDEVTQATGGNGYWMGTGNPVSFLPFFEDLSRRLDNQYELNFTTHLDRKPAVETFKLKVAGLSLMVAAPQEVYVDRSNVPQ